MLEGDEDAYRRMMEYCWFKLAEKTKGVIKPPVSHLLDPEDALISPVGACPEGLKECMHHEDHSGSDSPAF